MHPEADEAARGDSADNLFCFCEDSTLRAIHIRSEFFLPPGISLHSSALVRDTLVGSLPLISPWAWQACFGCQQRTGIESMMNACMIELDRVYLCLLTTGSDSVRAVLVGDLRRLIAGASH